MFYAPNVQNIQSVPTESGRYLRSRAVLGPSDVCYMFTRVPRACRQILFTFSAANPAAATYSSLLSNYPPLIRDKDVKDHKTPQCQPENPSCPFVHFSVPFLFFLLFFLFFFTSVSLHFSLSSRIFPIHSLIIRICSFTRSWKVCWHRVGKTLRGRGVLPLCSSAHEI